jgi:hypothetical protein
MALLTEHARNELPLPHSRATALEWGRKHARLELTNDFDVLRPTISTWDQNFTILSSAAAGDLALATAFDAAEVEEFYLRSHDNRQVVDAQCHKELNARWYQFSEQHAGLRTVATGELERILVANIYPAWTDGILGELVWIQPTWAAQTVDAEQQIALSRQLDAFDDAWRAGDVEAKLATIEDQTCSAIRVVETPGGHRHRAVAWTKEELREAWSRPEAGRVLELERVHHCATAWYVFASYTMLIDVGGRSVERETAAILPVGPNRKFIGELSYSMQGEL